MADEEKRSREVVISFRVYRAAAEKVDAVSDPVAQRFGPKRRPKTSIVARHLLAEAMKDPDLVTRVSHQLVSEEYNRG